MNGFTHTVRRLRVLPLLFLGVFFLWPVLSMMTRYVRFSTLIDVITDSSLRGVWWFTFWQAALSTLLTVLIGLPITWALSRHRFLFSRFMTGLVTVPFLMPAVVIASGVRAVLPNMPVLGILWAHLAFNVAVIVRVVGPRWALLDPAMEQTSADLGASPLRTFIYVVWPHIRTAVRNASSMVFLFCFSSFAVIAILGGISRRTIESEIFTQAVRLGNIKVATSLATLQAIVVICILLFASRHSTDTTDISSINVQLNPLACSSSKTFVYIAAYVPLVVVLTPLFAVIAKSFILNDRFTLKGYTWLFDGSTSQVGINAVATLITSLIFATICALIATTLALIIGLSRSTQSVISSLTGLPLVVSAVTLGLGIIVTFQNSPFAWRSEKWLIPVIHAVIALPLTVRILTPAIAAIPRDLHEASASLGADTWRTFWKIDIPLLQPAILRSLGLAAAISIGEFGATSFLSRSGAETIPMAISQLLSHPGDVLSQTAYALATLCIVGLSILFSVL